MGNKILIWIGVLGIISIVLISGCTDDNSNTNTGTNENTKKEKFDIEILCAPEMGLTVTNMNSYDYLNCTLIVNDKYYLNGEESNVNLRVGENGKMRYSITDFYSRSKEPMVMYEQAIHSYELKCNEGREGSYC